MLPSSTGPPPVWRNDLRPAVPNSQEAYQAPSADGVGSYAPSSMSEGYRHVRQVTGAQPSVDLYDLLLNTKNEETYQPYFQGWPALLKPVSPDTCDLPLRVQEKYVKCQTMCFCGVFPAVQLAWASIDNCLYLWRYDRRGDVPVEYCGEEQAICAVGLVKPRPGVFLEAIEHVIVLCTTTEIVLLGLCLGSGTSSTLPSIALQPLPMYSVSSDNVVMTCVAGSKAGRIFLGGSDGHLYELQYAATESWVQKRFSKVRLTGKLQQLLPSFIPAMLGYTKSATERVVVDDDRHILYCLNTPGHIQVFDLGAKGTEAAKKVAEIRDVSQAASQTSNGRDVFRNVSRDAESAAIKYLAPISSAESTKLHLLAITSDGRRVYLTTHPLRGSSYTRDPNARPVLLQPVFARHASPDAGMTLPRSQADWARPAAGQRIMCMHASKGCLLMAEPGGAFGQSTKLLLTAQNPTLPLASALTSSGVGSPALGLRELLYEMDNVLEGETVCIESIPRTGLLESLPPGATRSSDELVSQVFNPPPRFVLMSTAGIMQVEKRRPLEVLSSLLEERKEQLIVQFFEAFGPVEAAAMCLALACAPRTAGAASVGEAARACLEDPVLVGEARMPQSGTQASPGSGLAAPLGAGIYMGQAVNPNPEPDWSAAYRGICLYVSRLLAPVWEAPVARPATQQAGDAASVLVQVHLPRQAMEEVEAKLRGLDQFLQSYLTRRQQQGSLARYRAATSPLDPAAGGIGLGGAFGLQVPAGQDDDRLLKRQRLVPASQMEDDRTRRVQVLVDKTAQALALLRLLLANNLARIAATLDMEARKQLTRLTLRDLVCESSGEQLAAQLISVLVTQQIDNASGAPGSVVTSVGAVAKLLSRHCPAFFKEDDRLYYQASAQLRAAMLVAAGPERDALTQSALEVLLRVPLSANLELVASQLAFLGAYKGMVDVALAAGNAVDPIGAALRADAGPDCQDAAARRRDKYKPVLSALRSYMSGVGNPASTAATEACLPADRLVAVTPAQRTAAQSALLKASFAAKDAFFHACLYEALIEQQEAATLLAANPPHLQDYLLNKSGLQEALVAAASGQPGSPVGPLTGQQYSLGHLLAQLFVQQGQFSQAAGVYMSLAGRRSGPGEQAVPITERVKCMQSAVLQARSLGDSRLVDKVEADARLMKLQAVCVKRVQELRSQAGQEGGPDLGRMEDELTATPLDVTQLYNDFAQPLKLWDVCLQLVDFAANRVDTNIVRQLWDLALTAAVQDARSQHQVDAFEAAAALVEELGAQFYPRDSFPLEHVTSRLVQIALKSWPPASGPEQVEPPSQRPAEQRVVRTLLATCSSSLPTVMRTLELLLAQRGDMPELSSNATRLQLLRCLLECCTAELKELRSAMVTPGLVPFANKPAATQMDVTAQRKASLLYDACARFELEAGRMSMPDARALAESFNKMRSSLRSYSRGTLLDVL